MRALAEVVVRTGRFCMKVNIIRMGNFVSKNNRSIMLTRKAVVYDIYRVSFI